MNSFLISFVLVALATPAVMAMAWRMGWVARPREDRWHRRPTALMGGVAIFFGTVASWVATCDWHTIAPVALLATAMFALGLIDDRCWELRPHQKLIGQLAAGAVLLAVHVQFSALPPLLALPLALVWVVGITNAVNLLDNMDGLAAGVSCISALALAAYCIDEGARAVAPAVLALAGSCAGFLLYNFNPARIFMGDCGSLFIGFSLAALAIQASNRAAPNLVLSLLVPVAVLAIPIFDTTLVAVVRFMNGRPIMPGFRDHSSHRMVSLGLSERSTVLIFYLLTALAGGLALAAARLPLVVVVLNAGLVFLGLTTLGLYLGFLKVYPEPEAAPSTVRFLRTRLFYKKQLLQVVLDTLLIPLAFVGAHVIRFEGQLPPMFAEGVLAALPLVLLAKLAGLALWRTYRGVWRYAGMADALVAIAGSTTGSLLAVLLVATLQGFRELSRGALVVDWLLLTLLVVAGRLSYRILQQLFAMLPARGGPRVLILGAGEETLALICQLRDPLSPNRAHVAGILDEDPAAHGRLLNGVPVLGPLAALPGLVEAHQVTHCFLGVPAQSAAGEAILDWCRCHGIALYQDPATPRLTNPQPVAAAA
jgi:UDP-GlcNAc:undecaprenyl-phosphate/decaprenyl-phosphate GlcNAc-1-phosphate transferase